MKLVLFVVMLVASVHAVAAASSLLSVRAYAVLHAHAGDANAEDLAVTVDPDGCVHVLYTANERSFVGWVCEANTTHVAVRNVTRDHHHVVVLPVYDMAHVFGVAALGAIHRMHSDERRRSPLRTERVRVRNTDRVVDYYASFADGSNFYLLTRTQWPDFRAAAFPSIK